MAMPEVSRSRLVRHLRAPAMAAALLLAASPLAAEPIKVIVPIPPGSSLDILSRVLAEQIGRAQGPTMIVENRPGASAIVGTDFVARAAPDGNTLLASGTALVINPYLHKTNYDPLTSFAPVCRLASSPTVIAVSSQSPYATLPALFDAARARPGALSLASIGPGSTTHLAFEKLKREAKVDMTFVPYPGTAPAFDAVLGQHVSAYFGEASFVATQVKAGTMRALATASARRLTSLPDVPALMELGFVDIMAELWFGILAPARTPQPTTDRLTALYMAALQAPDVKTKLTDLGLVPVGLCGAEFAAFLRRQFEDYGRLVTEAGIKAD
jgi:tripartite-type tricarboxylate transporter receptor subunit TctC